MPVASVTGSDSGVGRATAVALARDGYLTGESVVKDGGPDLMMAARQDRTAP